MNIKERINSIISEMKLAGEHITVDSIITKSLFSKGGTLTGYEEDIKEILWQIRERIERRILKNYNVSEGVTGFAVAYEVNLFFNEPETIKFVNETLAQ